MRLLRVLPDLLSGHSVGDERDRGVRNPPPNASAQLLSGRCAESRLSAGQRREQEDRDIPVGGPALVLVKARIDAQPLLPDPGPLITAGLHGADPTVIAAQHDLGLGVGA